MNDRSQTSLTRYAPQMRDPDPNGPHALAVRKWHEDGSIVILPASKARLDRLDRELLDAICTKLYGARREV